MKNKKRLITTIDKINFYTYDTIAFNKELLIFTDDENYTIDANENEIKACIRIYNNYYC